MADILIPRMILPQEGERYYLTIDHNGDVCRFVRKKTGYEPNYTPYSTAIELPPHGRLIDADELLASDAIDWGEDAWYGIKNAPTVLEGNYGSDN